MNTFALNTLACKAVYQQSCVSAKVLLNANSHALSFGCCAGDMLLLDLDDDSIQQIVWLCRISTLRSPVCRRLQLHLTLRLEIIKLQEHKYVCATCGFSTPCRYILRRCPTMGKLFCNKSCHRVEWELRILRGLQVD